MDIKLYKIRAYIILFGFAHREYVQIGVTANGRFNLFSAPMSNVIFS